MAAMRRVKFTYEQEMIKRPIIYDMGHKFKITTNVRRADVREDMGWVVLELVGDEEEIQSGLDWAVEHGVRVDPVEGDVIEG